MTSPGRKITVGLLTKHDACDDQIQTFSELFPKGVDPTVELARQHASDFDWDWAASHLLSSDARVQYGAVRRQAWEQYRAVRLSARVQYGAVQRQALEQYGAVQRPAREQYKAVQRQALEQYEAVERPAREQYEAVRRQAWEQYNYVCATAFVEAWNGDLT